MLGVQPTRDLQTDTNSPVGCPLRRVYVQVAQSHLLRDLDDHSTLLVTGDTNLVTITRIVGYVEGVHQFEVFIL